MVDAEELNLAALRRIDVERAMERSGSVEFQELLTQEYNLALFRSKINNAPSKQLAKDLEQYIQKLGGSI